MIEMGGEGFESWARNHPQASQPLEFRFEITSSDPRLAIVPFSPLVLTRTSRVGTHRS